MTITYAIVFGLIFGIILHKIGATNPNNIINMLRLKDLHLMKIILFAIGFASLFVFIALAFELYTPNFSVKSAYNGVVIGGLIFGAGWALSGFCPGTSVVSAGAGRKDAIVFIVGGLLGAFIYMKSYASLKGTFLFDKILGGKTTIADTGKYNSLFDGSSVTIAIVIAIVLIIIGFSLPKKKNA